MRTYPGPAGASVQATCRLHTRQHLERSTLGRCRRTATAEQSACRLLDRRGAIDALVLAKGSVRRGKELNAPLDCRGPSHKPIVWYKSFLYQAASWKTARRVVAKVEFHAGERFPRLGFIVTLGCLLDST